MLNISTSQNLTTMCQEPQTPQLPLLLNRQRINLESHQLVWLGELAANISLETLRKIIDYTERFTNVEECQQYIEIRQDFSTFLVCSNEFAEILIPQIHNLKNVKAIYIFDDGKKKDTATENPLPPIHSLKAKQIYTDSSQLLDALSQTVTATLQQNQRFNSEILELQQEDRNADQSNPSWLSLIKFWLYLPYPDDSRQQFINTLKTYYEGNNSKLNILQEFENTYKSEEAIKWYTRETFLYSQLNRALSQHNIQLLFLYGFFLQDIHRQLECVYYQQRNSDKFTCYRGQLISRKEIEQIMQNVKLHKGTTFVNSSLFSTTLDRRLALFYLNTTLERYDDFQSVLFEIEVDRRLKSQSFADITHLSHFGNESEVLFIVGQMFLIMYPENIYYQEEEKIWIIKMQLYERDNDENYFTTQNKRISLRQCVTLLSTSINSDSFTLDHLESICQQLFHMYPSESCLISAIQSHSIASYQYVQLNSYRLALSTYKKALELWSKCIDDKELHSYNEIGQIHFCIAQIFQYHFLNLKMARKHCGLAIRNFHKALQNNVITNYEKLKLYKHLANVYEDRMKMNHNNKEDGLMSIKYLELHSAENVTNLSTLEIIARISIDIQNYDKAISTYEKFLERLSAIVEPSQWTIRTIIHIYENLVTIYFEHKKNYDLALKYQLLKHEYEEKVDVEDISNPTEFRKKESAKHCFKLRDIYRKMLRYEPSNEWCRSSLLILLFLSLCQFLLPKLYYFFVRKSET